MGRFSVQLLASKMRSRTRHGRDVSDCDSYCPFISNSRVIAVAPNISTTNLLVGSRKLIHFVLSDPSVPKISRIRDGLLQKLSRPIYSSETLFT